MIDVGYVLQGVLGSSPVLAQCRVFQHARIIAISQNLRLLLMTDDFFDEARQEEGVKAPLPGFWKLPPGFDRLLAAWSMRGPVAYVEADYFGGVGTQAAAVWDTGDLALGPLAEAEDSPALARVSPFS